jgi:hypothetical protein
MEGCSGQVRLLITLRHDYKLQHLKINIILEHEEYFQDVRQSRKSGKKMTSFSLLLRNFRRRAQHSGRLHTAVAGSPWRGAKDVSNVASWKGWRPEQRKNLGAKLTGSSGRSLQTVGQLCEVDNSIQWSTIKDPRGSSRFSDLESAKSTTSK